METEYFTFILWEKAKKKQTEILNDIQRKFEICKVLEITWPKSDFQKNLKRFYGITLVDPAEKERQCGNGPFLLLILADKKPKHGKRKTSLGSQIVNTNIYDNKMTYRKILGSGFIVHSSIHKKESEHDFMLLLGKTIQEIKSQFDSKWDGNIEKIKSDLFGNKWQNPKEIFQMLNSTINYVVLRNFEEMPNNLITEKHADIDLLTDEQWQIPHVLNMKKVSDVNVGFSPFVIIKNNKIKFDIKYVGDRYYDENWSRDMLRRRKLNKNGVFVPSDKDHFFSLLYHMIIHKRKLSDDYCEKLFLIAPDQVLKQHQKKDFTDFNKLNSILIEFMKENNYKFTDSFIYKLSHNEIVRIYNVSKFTLKHEGIGFLLRAIKSKVKRTI